MRAQALQSVAVAGSKPYGSSSNSLLLPTPLQLFFCNSSFTGKACSKCARVASGPRLPKRPRIIGPAGHLCWLAKACQGKKHVVVRPCGGGVMRMRAWGGARRLCRSGRQKCPFAFSNFALSNMSCCLFLLHVPLLMAPLHAQKQAGVVSSPCFSNAGGGLVNKLALAYVGVPITFGGFIQQPLPCPAGRGTMPGTWRNCRAARHAG